MVTDPFLVGVFFGFVPAMGFLYIVLRQYDSFFNEKRIFRTFFVGIIFGVLVTVAELVMIPIGGALSGGVVTFTTGLYLLTFAGLMGLLESLAFASVLNWRTFRGRRDTPFYGVAFGFGFGATHVIALIMIVLQSFQTNGGPLAVADWLDVVILCLIGLYFIGGILVHGAMGAWIGQGAGTGPLPPAVFQSTLVRGAYEGLFFAMVLAQPPILGYALALAGVAFGVWLIARVLRTLLDRVVPPEILREMDIHNRRVARRTLRDDDQPPG